MRFSEMKSSRWTEFYEPLPGITPLPRRQQVHDVGESIWLVFCVSFMDQDIDQGADLYI